MNAAYNILCNYIYGRSTCAPSLMPALKLPSIVSKEGGGGRRLEKKKKKGEGGGGGGGVYAVCDDVGPQHITSVRLACIVRPLIKLHAMFCAIFYPNLPPLFFFFFFLSLSSPPCTFPPSSCGQPGSHGRSVRAPDGVRAIVHPCLLVPC